MNAQLAMLVANLKDKEHIKSCVLNGMAAGAMVYGTVALSVALFFGRNVDASCNVNWRGFVFAPLRLLVVGFPALDVFSVFPMNVVIAANNLMALAYPDDDDDSSLDVIDTAAAASAGIDTGTGSSTSSVVSRSSSGSSSSGNIGTSRISRSSSGSVGGAALSGALASPWVRGVWRFGVALPSIALSLVWWELDLILAFTGVVGMGIAFVLPALLHPKALARCQEHRSSSLSSSRSSRFSSHASAELRKSTPSSSLSPSSSSLLPSSPFTNPSSIEEGFEKPQSSLRGISSTSSFDPATALAAPLFLPAWSRALVHPVLVFGCVMGMLAFLDALAVAYGVDMGDWVR
jgi:hypothetical protein